MLWKYNQHQTGGALYRSEIYNKNPLVNVACIGLMKKENIIYGNALNEDSVLILCGAKTGNEGVDSAIMASQQSNDTIDKNIQKADAYLENLLLDAFMEISEKKLAEGFKSWWWHFMCYNRSY